MKSEYQGTRQYGSGDGLSPNEPRNSYLPDELSIDEKF